MSGVHKKIQVTPTAHLILALGVLKPSAYTVKIMIRDVLISDARAIAEIYNYYVENTVITFEEQAVSASEFKSRIQSVQSLGLPWLVAIENSSVVGYAYATKWKDRSAYRFSVETTVYLSQESCGKGLGSKLYNALLSELKNRNVKSAIGGITLPNPSSVSLHEKMGMKKVAHFEKVGFKFNQWQDVGYWQLSMHT
ncbi:MULTISPECIES: arsinothricin resistance N-acetyltransferase ArsN1 family B [unclassified Endozoicomonas]|uniref:arsinothricin resistance N-acetyltransferase ArsN1 family B n=1 Tax=unclassified Endozoicomonas TaxID=2644528 RepID=UPI003BB49B51